MRKFYLLLLAGLFVVSQIMSGCSAAGSAISAGEDAVAEKKYDVAIEQGVKAVKADPEEPADAYTFLNTHYDTAINYYNGIISTGKAGSGVEAKLSVFEAYQSLQKITKSIKTIKTPYTNADPKNAFTFNPTAKDYTSKIESARKVLAEEYYKKANELAKSPQWTTQQEAFSYLSKLNKLWGKSYKKHKELGAELYYQRALQLEKHDNRTSYREAAKAYESSLKWVGKYKDVKDRLEVVNRKAYVTFYVMDDKNILGRSAADSIADSLYKSLGSSFKNFNSKKSRRSYSEKLAKQYPGVQHTIKSGGFNSGDYKSAVQGAKKVGLNYIVFVKSSSSKYNRGQSVKSSKKIKSDKIAYNPRGGVIWDKRGKPIKFGFPYSTRWEQIQEHNKKSPKNKQYMKVGEKKEVVKGWKEYTATSWTWTRKSTLDLNVQFVIFDVNAQSVVDTVTASTNSSGKVEWVSYVSGSKKLFAEEHRKVRKGGKKPYSKQILLRSAKNQISSSAASIIKPVLQVAEN